MLKILSNKMEIVTLLGFFGLFIAIALGQNTQYKPQIRNDGSFGVSPKTAFTCQGRGAGYYADVETGCSIYHMCDGLGRQFSYSCPNTTLFQQRMLICDHWYMVNCSRAESNYAANLLIGQRDKPFVSESENEVRTPRPDLLDRPYAADYKGNSYRKFYPIQNTTPAPPNRISDVKYTKSVANKGTSSEIFHESASNHGRPSSWNTRYAKEDVFESTTSIPLYAEEEEIQTNNLKNNERRDIKGDESKETIVTASSELRTSKEIEASDKNNRIDGAVPAPSKRYEPPPPPHPTTSESRVVNTTDHRPVLESGYKPFENILNFGKKGMRKDYDFSNFFNRNITNTLPTTTSTVATSTTPSPRTTTTIKTTTRATQRPTARPFVQQTITQKAIPQQEPTIKAFIPRQDDLNAATFKPFVPKQDDLNAATFKPFVPKQEDLKAASFRPKQEDLNAATFKPFVLSQEDLNAATFKPFVPKQEDLNAAAFRPFGQNQEAQRREDTPRILVPQGNNLFKAPSTELLPPHGPIRVTDPFFKPFIEEVPLIEPNAVPDRLVPVKVDKPSLQLLPPYESVSDFKQIHNQFLTDTIYTRQPVSNNPSSGPINFGISIFELGQNNQQVPFTNDADTGSRPFGVPTPATDLLPPNEITKYYDDSTTQGPPIYYEWKSAVPTFGLLPPPPPPPSSTDAEDEKLLKQLIDAQSPDTTDSHNQTARSISTETGNLGENHINNKSTKPQFPLQNYLELRRKLSIPDFVFPLESESRTGYEQAEAKNSFQIKIPPKISNEKPWYGENEKCPECHPSFLRPGSCEPCVKIRR